jgi:hypothetical protein
MRFYRCMFWEKLMVDSLPKKPQNVILVFFGCFSFTVKEVLHLLPELIYLYPNHHFSFTCFVLVQVVFWINFLCDCIWRTKSSDNFPILLGRHHMLVLHYSPTDSITFSSRPLYKEDSAALVRNFVISDVPQNHAVQNLRLPTKDHPMHSMHSSPWPHWCLSIIEINEPIPSFPPPHALNLQRVACIAGFVRLREHPHACLGQDRPTTLYQS